MIKQIFHLLIALLVLIASSGMTINRMECLKTGKVKASIFDIKKCCPENNSTSNAIQSKCCNFSLSYLKVDINTTLEKQKISEQFALSFFEHFVISYFSISDNSVSRNVVVSSLPPLLSGKSLLQAIRVFRI
ncbi:MAG: HYC_CC_PP family protein [Bacteroidia bacterium]